ncbi:MAG: YhfC family glutamic-type intramembrane protease [Candidatus Bathyarchaeia archaeon]|jgi:hypothetical protein
MQNIDALYLLQPVVTIAFSAGLVIHWHLKRRFTALALLCSLLAYGGAIACKVIFQAITFNALMVGFHGDLSILGTYFGIQTVVFEVGGAYLVAKLAVSRGKLEAGDAAAYGLGLAFWENAGYLGVLGIFSLLSIYLTFSAGTISSLELYSNLITNRPTLFYPPLQALPLIGFSILERVSSLLFHFCWGYLCLLSASTHNRRYFLLALPMGLLDFFVPFANYFGIPFFELFIYVLGLSTLGLTLFITKEARRSAPRHP